MTITPTSARRWGALSLIGALGAAVLTTVPAQADEAPTELFISEYIEGSGYNKAVEIYNPTSASVDLSDYQIRFYSNANTGPQATIDLVGTVAPGDVFVLASSNTSSTNDVAALADQTSGSIAWNGNDPIELLSSGAVVDLLGVIGTGDYYGQDVSLSRNADVCTGAATFDIAEWTDAGTNVVAGLGSHTASCGDIVVEDVPPTVASIVPADGAGNVAVDVEPVLTFSEPVALADLTIQMFCDTPFVGVAVTGGPTEYTLTPTAPLTEGDSCSVLVLAEGVSDLDGDTDLMAEDFTSGFTVTSGPIGIGEVQGAGAASPYVDQSVTVEGVVVADHEDGGLAGFYLQTRDGEHDADPATSEGIFVYNPDADSVSLGDDVTVTGTVAEYFGQTQIEDVSIEVNASGQTVTAAEVALPFADAAAPEAYEGMLVEFPETLTVTEVYLLGRYGQVTLSGGGRLDQPSAVVAPGPDAIALQAQNDLNQIIFEDAFTGQNTDPMTVARGGEPLSAENTLRGGDTVTGMTGVMTYGFSEYRVRPLAVDGETPDFQPTNPRPTEAPEVGGGVKVASFNVLNYFLTIDEGSNVCGPVGEEQGCRGADSALELERQTDKLVQALAALDADVIGIMEMENTPGVEPLAHLADLLDDELGTSTWDYVDTGVVGTDVIRVGFLYDSAAVSPAGVTAVLDSSVDVRFDDDRNRPSVASSFEETGSGETFTVVANHWKSKGSCPSTGLDADQGDGAACWNATRTSAAEALVDWMDTYPTEVEDDDVIIMGDLNSYGQEDPIQVLRDAGYVELGDDYSYVFDGQWGSLDYAFASASMAAQVTGAEHFHINSDEPISLDYNVEFKTSGHVETLYAADMYRTSDHDPVLIGLDLGMDVPPPFIDADESLEHYAHILWLAQQGISKGWTTPGGQEYRPYETATRDAIAAFLFRWLSGEEGAEAPEFSDVSEALEHYEAIAWLADSGITTGYADGSFKPFAPVTRDAMAAFLYRAAGSPEFDAPETPTFSDVTPETSAFYAEIEWAASQGIVTGWADGTFRPFEPITRDAIAAFLHRATMTS